ncbi:sterile alpha motif (SAM) domain-containing protein [Striga asiatica]|uniref:Sterile alpha motif (SAM) domain-containing protein n=1 Tax=Striga asiatica TaxID=4170 RepID=A0A5A7PX10_STRAF|nr:sterile alpha motif (SAM) domain-containing protein [Striga asiatica]
MDWCSWLSKTSLEPSLAYEYGQALIRNELQLEDLTYFNHEFLQSLGIFVAKHRLEILKLARKEVVKRGITMNYGLSRLVSAVNKTRKLITKNISKLGPKRNPSSLFPFNNNNTAPDESPYRNHWSGALKRVNVGPGRNAMWSGPLDKRMMQQQRCSMGPNSVSGPLDGGMIMRERAVYPDWSPMGPGRPINDGRVKDGSGFVCRSPTVSGPIERLGLSPHMGYGRGGKVVDRDQGAQSLWSIMFRDMKPT